MYGLKIDRLLHEFVDSQVLPGLPVTTGEVWGGLAELVRQAAPRIRQAVDERSRLQEQLDDWHRQRAGLPHDAGAYRAFLETIGYLVAEGESFVVETDRVDAEVSDLAGPQLVVPVSNARYAVNAANARWGSLYDALYGTDALGTRPPSGSYDAARGAAVIAWGRQFLDDIFPLNDGSHADARSYGITHGQLSVLLSTGTETSLRRPEAFTGYAGEADSPGEVLLTHHGLGVIIAIDHDHLVGKADSAGIHDVIMEAAVTAIIDFEDSVAAVDAEDKVAAYANWLGLMRGDLTASVAKGGRSFERKMTVDRRFVGPDGAEFERRGRSLMLVRIVGHLMTTPAVLDEAGAEIPETLLDSLLTVLIAMHDFQKAPDERNSPAGSVYVVKPKLHGPEEARLTDEIFAIVERALSLSANTVKVGMMDEERRTTVNLKECIRATRHRIAFINTGFLDRTGDEIHTSSEAGPMIRKGDMRSASWLKAYEDWNVDVGLACGLRGKAQIGKGMWAAPDDMAQMLDQKLAHPLAGATTAWVPSPTAATLHATHYHRVDVTQRQAQLLKGGLRATLDDILAIPVADDTSWDAATRQAELDNNAQGILGYVVRWVDHGVGCSKVPDINNVALMEDRATCRISSQHIANWLRHGVVTPDEVTESLRRMAAVVDRQNADDPSYQPMAPGCDGEAYRAAHALVFEGGTQPSGYTEPILHEQGAEQKALAKRTPA